METNDAKTFYERLNKIQRQMDRILGILETDNKIKEKGLVEKVSLIEKLLNELLTREKIYKAKATTWGIIGGAVGTAAFWLIKIVLAKIVLT